MPGKLNTIKRFGDGIEYLLTNAMPDYKITQRTVTKNNGVSYSAITITEQNSCIGMSLPLDEFFERYTNDNLELIDICNEIINVVKTTQAPADMKDTVNNIRDFDKIRDRIVIKLVNAKRNNLNDVPHILLCGDIAITFAVIVADDGVSTGSIKINSELANEWGVNTMKLLEIGKSNTQTLLPPMVFPIDQLSNVTAIRSSLMMNKQAYKDIDSNELMHVCTNITQQNGANVILYDDMLESIANDIQDDLYIIMSSIHETLIFAASVPDINSMKSFVPVVNANEVDDEEVLSDKVYKYNRSTQCLSALN